MSGPWEKYGAAPAPAAPSADTSGPWSKYGAPSPGDGIPGGGVAGNRNVGKPEERPVNGVDVLLGHKGLAGDAFDKVLGVVETPITVASGAIGGLAGAVAGLGKAAYKKITTGQGSTDQEIDKTVRSVAGAIVRPPSTSTGNTILEGLGHVMEPLAALPSAELLTLGRAASSANTGIRGLATPSAAAADAADAATLANGARGTLRELVAKPKPALSGVGAAQATEEAQRAARFKQFNITPTKGQLSRDFDQIAFEQEAAKQKEGVPLRNRAVEQNQQIDNVFYDWYDQTQARNYGVRAAGKSADTAINNKHAAMRQQVEDAYTAADQAGETAQQVPYKTLADYLEHHSAEIDTNNVPMLAAVRAKLAKLDPEGTGSVTVKQMEEVRKMAGRLTTPGTPNEAHIGDVKRVIDAATEGAGGDLYREARRLNTLKENQFGDNKTIAKLISDKPGYTDRAVPMADVTDHLLFDGSTEDVLHVRRVLTAGAGEEGAQAWKDLQGAAVNKMREMVFPAGGQTNTASEVVARAKRFSEKVDEWKNEGRLEALFGNEGSAKVLDFNDALKDLFPPPGTVNTSNTASAILRAFNKTTSVTGSVPGLTSATKFIQGKVESAVLKKRVDAAVNPDKAK